MQCPLLHNGKPCTGKVNIELQLGAPDEILIIYRCSKTVARITKDLLPGVYVGGVWITDLPTSIDDVAELVQACLDGALPKWLYVELGRKGGQQTAAKHDAEYFKRIQSMRKTKAGGRPRKVK